jgi:hypothetical protein
MEKVAIVILNWNGAEMIRQYLPNVMEYSSSEASVYVADNASTDGSLELLRQSFPDCRLILLDKNWGFADGYNKALQQIDAEYYLLLNSDIEVTPNWLTPLIKLMDANPDVAACQPKLLSMIDRHSFEYAGACGGFLDRYGYPFCRGRVFETLECDEGQYNTRADLLWATGAALMIRSADYWDVGGLDGRFFAHNEEIDLCWRLRIKGRRILCEPQSVVYHLGGGTLPKTNPMKTYLNFRNNLTMLYKCLPENELKHVMRVRWWLDYLAAFEMLLLKHNWQDFLAVFRARKSYYNWRKDFEEDRRKIQSGYSASNISQRTGFSLLWLYYVKRRRCFSEIMG